MSTDVRSSIYEPRRQVFSHQGPYNSIQNIYSKCPKISNTFPFLLSINMLVIRSGIHKMRVRIAIREDPDQTASSEAVWSGSALFV